MNNVPIIQSVMSTVFGEHSAYSSNQGLGKQTSLLGNQTTLRTSVDDMTKMSRFETPQMYEFVRNHHLIETATTLIKSIVIDLLSDSELKVSTGNDVYDVFANELIKTTDLKKRVLDNLEDYLFWGNYGTVLNRQTKKFQHLANPFEFSVYHEEDTPKLVLTKNLSGELKPIRVYDGYWQQYRPKTVKAFSTKKDNDGLFLENDFRQGCSIFRGAILKIYSCFIKEYICDQMSLKEALKNDVVVANINNNKTSTGDQGDAVDMISNLLNDQESMSLLSKSPEALLRLIDQKMVNYINVVPGIQNFTDFSKVEVFSLRDKLAMLRDDIKEDEASSLDTIGIPRELISGESNKWDAINRSTRLVNLISMVNSSLFDAIKTFISNQIHIQFGKKVPVSKISTNINPSEVLLNEDVNQKFDTLNRRVEALTTIANNYKELVSNEAIDGEKLFLYLSNKLSAIDTALGEMLVKTEPDKTEQI